MVYFALGFPVNSACICLCLAHKVELLVVMVGNNININNNQENTQSDTNLIINSAAKITEDLSQPNENSDAKQDGIQHTKARLGGPKEKMEKQSIAWAVH